MSNPYHSALREEVEYPEVFRVANGGSVALVHDVMTGVLPQEFDRCDVLYAEPPWKDGASVFDQRLGLTGRQYSDLMAGIGKIVSRARGLDTPTLRRVPVIVITGKQGLKHLPAPDHRVPTRIHGAEAIAACWGIAPVAPWKSTRSVMEELASRFRVAGDFCCGYGQLADYFREPERSCVLSDYNPRCIGGVAARWEQK